MIAIGMLCWVFAVFAAGVTDYKVYGPFVWKDAWVLTPGYVGFILIVIGLFKLVWRLLP